MGIPVYAVAPTTKEILDAIWAGYRSVDNLDGFAAGFEGHLAGLGYSRQNDAPCTCPDSGWHGHMPECGWLRDWPSGGSKTGESRPVP